MIDCMTDEPDRPLNEPNWRLEHKADFSVAEYNAIRAEIVQTLAGQQSIMAWSVGAIGVVVAGLVALSDKSGDHNNLILLVLGWLLPGLAASASFAWLGELFRMERDAAYLRALELTTWDDGVVRTARIADPKQWDPDVRLDIVRRVPLAYNAWVAWGRPSNRVTVGYLAGIAIYGLTILVSLAVFAWLVWRNHGYDGTETFALYATAAIVPAVFVLLMWRNGRRLLSYGRHRVLEFLGEAVLARSKAPPS